MWWNIKYNVCANSDYALPWQIGFQDAASPIMEGIIDLHHDIMFFMCGFRWTLESQKSGQGILETTWEAPLAHYASLVKSPHWGESNSEQVKKEMNSNKEEPVTWATLKGSSAALKEPSRSTWEPKGPELTWQDVLTSSTHRNKWTVNLLSFATSRPCTHEVTIRSHSMRNTNPSHKNQVTGMSKNVEEPQILTKDNENLWIVDVCGRFQVRQNYMFTDKLETTEKLEHYPTRHLPKKGSEMSEYERYSLKIMWESVDRSRCTILYRKYTYPWQERWTNRRQMYDTRVNVVDQIYAKLIEKGIALRVANKVKPTCKKSILKLEDAQIVDHYRGSVQDIYEKPIEDMLFEERRIQDKRSWTRIVRYFVQESLMRTLMHKHKISSKKVVLELIHHFTKLKSSRSTLLELYDGKLSRTVLEGRMTLPKRV